MTLKIKGTSILIRPYDKKGQDGCGFVIYKNPVSSVIYFIVIRSSFTLLIIKAKLFNIYFMNVNVPTEEKEGNIKKKSLLIIRKTIDEIPPNFVKVILSDFNKSI